MEFLTEISIPWLTEAIIAVCGLVVSFFSVIFPAYRSIIKKIDEGFGRLDTKIDAGLGKLDTKMDAGFAELRQEIRTGDAALREEIRTGDAALRKEIQTGDAALRRDIGLLTTQVMGLAEKGVGARRPEEVPAPAERIAEAG